MKAPRETWLSLPASSGQTGWARSAASMSSRPSMDVVVSRCRTQAIRRQTPTGRAREGAMPSTPRNTHGLSRYRCATRGRGPAPSRPASCDPTHRGSSHDRRRATPTRIAVARPGGARQAQPCRATSSGGRRGAAGSASRYGEDGCSPSARSRPDRPRSDSRPQPLDLNERLRARGAPRQRPMPQGGGHQSCPPGRPRRAHRRRARGREGRRTPYVES